MTPENKVVTEKELEKEEDDFPTTMDEKEYLKERLQSQLDWYDRKSSMNQRQFKKLRKVEIIVAALIPLIITLSTMGAIQDTKLLGEEFTLDILFQVVAALSGVLLVVLSGFNDLEGYFSKWKDYRSTAEELRQEKIKFMTRIEPYNTEDRFVELVNNVETILAQENQNWRVTVAMARSSEAMAQSQMSQANYLQQMQGIRAAKGTQQAVNVQYAPAGSHVTAETSHTETSSNNTNQHSSGSSTSTPKNEEKAVAEVDKTETTEKQEVKNTETANKQEVKETVEVTKATSDDVEAMG